eukprot:COSAG01_NODE_68246_length_264_cov_1.545455_1_plen_83_part_01
MGHEEADVEDDGGRGLEKEALSSYLSPITACHRVALGAEMLDVLFRAIGCHIAQANGVCTHNIVTVAAVGVSAAHASATPPAQ